MYNTRTERLTILYCIISLAIRRPYTQLYYINIMNLQGTAV